MTPTALTGIIRDYDREVRRHWFFAQIEFRTLKPIISFPISTFDAIAPNPGADHEQL